MTCVLVPKLTRQVAQQSNTFKLFTVFHNECSNLFLLQNTKRKRAKFNFDVRRFNFRFNQLHIHKD
jgi:hypothetical protein